MDYNELTGIELSNSVYIYLDEHNLNPIQQELFSSGENDFPYNIVIKKNNHEYCKKNLVFTFFQEDVLENKDLIKEFLDFIIANSFDFNITVLFSYGERQFVKKEGMVYGIDSFLDNINTNDDYTNIIIDLAAQKTSIDTSSEGIVAPSWLIQNEYNAYLNNNLKKVIPVFYLSQMYTFDFYYSRMLSSCFSYNVPAIKLNFLDNENNKSIILPILIESILSYDHEIEREWDRHFFMLKAFDNYKKLSEERTVQIIIIIIFSWLLFLFLFFFINSRLKKQAWGSIKHIWYSVPITFILVILGFLIGKYFFISFFETTSSLKNTLHLASLQIILSLTLVSIYYAITLLYNFSFYEKSIDYLIVISCFINQSIFILIDISLFPIFMAICLLALLAILIKRNSIHILIFFLMVTPFLPYLISIIKTVNFDSLYLFLTSQDYVIFFVSIILYPSYLIYFRILTSIRRKTKFNIQITIGIILILLSTLIIFIFHIVSNNLELKNTENSKNYILATTEDLIKINFDDNKVFDDIIRTLDVEFLEKPEQCSITLTSISSSPILYTENSFEYVTSTTSMFKIPSNPPQRMVFKYGSTKEPTIITVSAIFKNSENNDYKTTKKVVTIGSK